MSIKEMSSTEQSDSTNQNQGPSLTRSSKKIKKNYKTLTLDVSLYNSTSKRSKGSRRALRPDGFSKSKKNGKRSRIFYQDDQQYEPFAMYNYYPDQVQKYVQSKPYVTSYEINNLMANLHTPYFEDYQNSLQSMNAVCQAQEELVKEICRIKDNTNIIDYYVESQKEKKEQKNEVNKLQSMNPRKLPTEVTISQLLSPDRYENEHSYPFNSNSNEEQSGHKESMTTNDHNNFVNLNPLSEERETEEFLPKDQFKLDHSPINDRRRYSDNNCSTLNIKKKRMMCDKIEDLTDFFEFNGKNDIVEDLLDFENSSNKHRNADDLLFSKKIDYDNFLNFENQNQLLLN